MNKAEKEAVIMVLIALFVVILPIVFNFLIMPFLLMVALSAVGYEFSFFICMAFWLVASTVFSLIFKK